MKTKVYLFALTVMSAFGLQAQTIMNIHQSNGTVLQIPLNTIDSITYTIPNPGNLATLTTTTVSSITETTAVSGGNIANDGGTLITQRGVCYSTSSSPTTANMTIISGSGSGSFTSILTGLTANTTYYVRAYANNSAGAAYGNEVSFTTAASSGGIVTNPGAGVTFSGYTYASIVLGNGQEWMSENLRTSTYANGDPIPNVTNDVQWSNLTTGAWAHYDNNSIYENPYGKLYNWYTVDDPRNVCPNGWHVPSESEWNTLIGYLDPSYDDLDEISLTAGGMMKSTGIQYWQSPNQDATNVSGFSGLPGGLRAGTAGASLFVFIGDHGWWWSSTNLAPTIAYSRLIRSDDGEVTRDVDVLTSGCSVRCLRD